MGDPISDMLTRIRNAKAVLLPQVEVPFSKIKHEIAKILEKERFVQSVDIKGRRTSKDIVLILKYENKVPAISDLKRVSKPGQRIYVMSSELKRVKSGLGIAILSTSKGIMTDKEARRLKIGGELLCQVW
ncbi:MAG: 30S ribosomal protein S8 [Candidatus Wildermuthbacteria bacterium]|nr:30S ribosomal protein S8 [Candidatus Wildermuthbacteria bacterium]